MVLDQVHIKNEQGSTSVLIVVMMIVLMAFGMAALTTSYASYRMALKNSTFGDEYNQLDSKATQVEYDILIMMETLSLQIRQQSATLDKKDYHDFMNKKGSEAILAYVQRSQNSLVDAAYEQDDINSDTSNQGQIGTLRYTISLDGEQPKNLTVKLNILAPPLLGYTSYKDFIEVVEWYEWQEGVEGSGEIFFDDLFEEGDGF